MNSFGINIIVTIAAIFVSACNGANKKHIVGVVNDKTLDNIKYAPKNSSIILTSQGGNGDDALDVAEIIISKKLSVRIEKYCLSACADIIAPSGNRIIMVEEPLIGFHGNPFTDMLILNKLGEAVGAACESKRIERMKKILKIRKLPENAWMEEFKRIHFEKIEKIKNTNQNGSCPVFKFHMRDKFWFPTSQQLSILFGWKFEGSVCADNPECIKMKTRKYWKRGSSFLVGDEHYIS